MEYTHSHHSTISSLSSTAQLSPMQKHPPYTFLKTATIPTYHGISIAIPRYIAMQLPPFRFYDMHHHCHIALHDHIADIVFVAQPPFIIVTNGTLASLHILVHCQRHSYRVIFLF